ncbi:beta-glucosidase family protein [Thermoanaerobacterium thermosaccharolyticum]|uniref:Beta-glucosidase-like glycosyl hydrolase n=1 Tax=Thermoanaerobacterium thermosaccharolyticum M0795 TaxID=698948 RepID=L0IJZ9_THETR|nr:glycoside hydrolase family 3 C-terminal domain-containing protein [Thermoanaerobacterium thermosaccharolyticum]AGB18576.1 beta-glucosidase-like glycosyl hydrolase [Thermoanaerobacterium thermosaccharolyticum M0795]
MSKKQKSNNTKGEEVMSSLKEYRLSLTERAKDIVSKLTLEEKVYLMSGRVSEEELTEAFNISSSDVHYNYYPYPAGGNQRLNVPELKFCDGPRGVVCGKSTCFPVPMARGATFDPELEGKIGEAIAKEIRAYGGNFYGGVCVNLPYHPGWGRSQEVYGEDDFLLGKMGSALVKGVQKHNVIACVKHFAFNSMENARFTVNVKADQRTEQEVFLPHFKDCIDAGAAAVMSAYNKYNGTYCGQNGYLLDHVLKETWRFDGFVISDFIWGVRDTIGSATNGLDVEMCNTKFYGERLVKAVHDGLVSESEIDEAAVRIVRTLLAFADAKDPQEYTKELIACQAHIALAKRAAEEAMTLLKNDNKVLPFSKAKAKRIAVIGKLANKANIGDHGSSRVFPPYVVTPLAGIVNLMENSEVDYYNGEDLERAIQIAKAADAVVLVVGNDHDDEGEYLEPNDVAKFSKKIGGDRKNLGLHKNEIELIKKVGPINPNTAVVLIGGSMILMDEWKDYVPAILMAYYPGMEGGTVIAETLFGDVNPGGKLPFAIVKNEEDLPKIDWYADEITYGYYHGYTKLDKEGIKPLFPFGYGLSYTSFQISDPSFIVDKDNIIASCKVKNTGGMNGDEVIQFYVGFSNSSVDRPVKLLRGFQRVTLEPGQEVTVNITCPVEKLKWYNPQTSSWELEDITYEAYIGTSSDPNDLLSGNFRI